MAELGVHQSRVLLHCILLTCIPRRYGRWACMASCGPWLAMHGYRVQMGL